MTLRASGSGEGTAAIQPAKLGKRARAEMESRGEQQELTLVHQAEQLVRGKRGESASAGLFEVAKVGCVSFGTGP